MDSRQRWDRIRSAFDDIVELDEHARARRLAALRSTDPALAAEVEALLKADGNADAALASVESPFGLGSRLQVGAESLTTDLRARLQGALGDAYRVDRELGGGGMSSVFVAEETAFKRRVVIKVLRPDLAEGISAQRFGREIQLAARLQHPHIVSLLSAGEADGLLYYTMPFVDGESLRARVRREGELPIDDTVGILRDVTGALTYAHRLGVVHRDIKPENILLAEGGAVVVDFGIAKALRSARTSGDDLSTSLTARGTAVGTPVYMAPEQAADDPATDHRADLYALGAVAYEMLAGVPPFIGRSAQQLMAAHAIESPVPVAQRRPNTPPGLAKLVMQCLEKRPADRPRTADEVLMTLSDAAHLAAAPRPNQSGDIAAVSRLAQRRVLWLVGLALAIVAAGIAVLRITQWGSPDIRSVAVLPLTNLIGPDQEYFVEGMHEALIQELGQVGALKTVISRTSVMRYAATKKSISEIAKELSVDAVVEGSVFRAGDSIRVQLHLIGAVPREHQLWAATFDGEMRNALALQRTVASAIARQIRVGLTAPEQARLTNARTVDPVAYQLYLKGRYLLYPGGEAGLIQALEEFRQAIAIDSTFAPAYAGLARAYTLLGAWGSTIPPEAVRASARVAALQAIARDSTLAEAHIALAQIKWLFDWDWAGAEAAFQRGMKLSPSSATELYAYADFLSSLGRFDEAIAVDQRALEQDPLSPLGYLGLNLALMCQGRYDEALTQAKKLVELEPNWGMAHHVNAEAYIFQGKLDEAFKHTETAEKLWREAGDRSWLAYLVWGYAREHRRGDALRVLSQMDPTPTIWKAVAYAGLGDTEKSLSALEQAYQRHEVPLVYIKVRHVLDADRGDPRFASLLLRMKFPD